MYRVNRQRIGQYIIRVWPAHGLNKNQLPQSMYASLMEMGIGDMLCPNA